MSSHPIPRTETFWEADPYRDVQDLGRIDLDGEPEDDYDALPIADPDLEQLLDHLLGKDTDHA